MNLTDYIENNIDVSNEKLNDVLLRLRAVLSKIMPELDTTSTSPFGALMLLALARLIASAEESLQCILSDIDLENALNGNTCDCEFAEKFIKSLGLNSLINSDTVGVLRLTFKNDNNYINANDNTTIELDQGTSIVFNDEYLFHFIVSNRGPIKILIPNFKKELPENLFNENYFIASILRMDTNGNALEYYVDIPIRGPSNANISAGTVPSTDIKAEYLNNLFLENGIYNVNDITPYESPTTLDKLTKVTQKIYPSSNFSTKGGIISYFTKLYPRLNCISPVTTNDSESRVINTSDNVFTLDIFGKNGIEEVQCADFIKVSDPKSVIFCLQCRPKKINQIIAYKSNTEESTESLYTEDITTTCPVVYYPDKSPYQGENLNVIDRCFTRYCKNFQMHYIPDNTKYISISYTYDPYWHIMDNSMSDKPFVDTAIKNFYDLTITKLDIKYKKPAGTFIDRQTIVAQIHEFLNTLSYPVEYNDAYISDILLLNGASVVTNIKCKATFSPAYRIACEATGGEAAIGQGLSFFSLTEASKESTLKAGDVAIAIGPKNIAYRIEKDAINLIEETE